MVSGAPTNAAIVCREKWVSSPPTPKGKSCSKTGSMYDPAFAAKAWSIGDGRTAHASAAECEANEDCDELMKATYRWTNWAPAEWPKMLKPSGFRLSCAASVIAAKIPSMAENAHLR